MYDLLFAGPEFYKESQALLRTVYPDAVFEDASDDIHRGHYSIETGTPRTIETLIEHYTTLLVLGLHDLSFDFSLAYEMRGYPDVCGDDVPAPTRQRIDSGDSCPEGAAMKAVSIAFVRATYLRQGLLQARSAGVL